MGGIYKTPKVLRGTCKYDAEGREIYSCLVQDLEGVTRVISKTTYEYDSNGHTVAILTLE